MIETPILLTNTLGVGAAMEGAVRWTLAQAGNERVMSVNALVGETNDGAGCGGEREGGGGLLWLGLLHAYCLRD